MIKVSSVKYKDQEVNPVTPNLPYETDILPTSAGDLQITFLGHGSLMFTFKKLVIHVDPFSQVADYSKLPKADLILVTHEHMDHLDPMAMTHIQTRNTKVIYTEACSKGQPGGVVMHNGDEQVINDLRIQAVAAYNILHKRENGQPYHPRGAGNGYVITFGDQRVYVGGDTENIPEMKDLKDISVAFLPMNLPYTMTPAMTAEAARSFHPKILYPYHFSKTDTSQLAELLKADTGIEVRVRKMG
jgi:L-ascorbate metabolism protein UlaG (beta-lactamase superfamily)